MLHSKIQNAMHIVWCYDAEPQKKLKVREVRVFFLLGLVTLIIIIDMQVIPGGFFYYFANYVTLLYKLVKVHS